MSSIRNLLNANDGTIYIYLHDDKTATRFMNDAENEGFTFSDGVKPTQRTSANIMAVNRDCTINYVGTNGCIAYQAANKIGNEPLIKIDYRDIIKCSE